MTAGHMSAIAGTKGTGPVKMEQIRKSVYSTMGGAEAGMQQVRH